MDDADKPETDLTPPSEPSVDLDCLPEELCDKSSGESVCLNGIACAVEKDDSGTFELVSEQDQEELGVEEVHDHFNRLEAEGPADLEATVNSRWDGGELLARIKWATGSHDWIPAHVVKKDQPLMLAKHMLANAVEISRSGHWATWARKTVTAINRTIRRMR